MVARLWEPPARGYIADGRPLWVGGKRTGRPAKRNAEQVFPPAGGEGASRPPARIGRLSGSPDRVLLTLQGTGDEAVFQERARPRRPLAPGPPRRPSVRGPRAPRSGHSGTPRADAP